MKIIAGPLHFLHIKKAKSRMIRGFIRKELKTEKFSHFYFSLIHNPFIPPTFVFLDLFRYL